jgi:chromosome segregation ATPase
MPDRGLFVVVTVLVALIILVVKAAGAPAAPVAVFAVGSMLAYGLAAYRLPAVRIRLDRLGDNFYYMGFVFTLASMAAALLQLNAGMEVEALLGSFGIALLTTMAGIAGRVTFVQMRSEVDDVEERIRRDLLEAGDQLRSQLAAAVRDLEAFRLGTQQMLQERMEQTLDKYTEAAVGQVTRLGSTAQEIMDRVDTAFGANHEHAQELNRIAQKTVEAADRLLTRIAAINPPPDVIERKLDGFTERLTASAQAFVEASAAEQERQKALAGFGLQLEETLGRLGQQTAGLDAGFGSISKVGASLSTALEDLNTKLASLGVAVAIQEKELSTGVQGITRVREQLDADLSASRAAVLDVQRALADTARVVKAELQGAVVQ